MTAEDWPGDGDDEDITTQVMMLASAAEARIAEWVAQLDSSDSPLMDTLLVVTEGPFTRFLWMESRDLSTEEEAVKLSEVLQERDPHVVLLAKSVGLNEEGDERITIKTMSHTDFDDIYILIRRPESEPPSLYGIMPSSAVKQPDAPPNRAERRAAKKKG